MSLYESFARWATHGRQYAGVAIFAAPELGVARALQHLWAMSRLGRIVA
jgi:hypothetical protein